MIENIYDKPVNVIFENDDDKNSLTTTYHNSLKQWQDLLYLVDVEVVKIQDKIIRYKILKVYVDDTLELNND